MPTLFCTNTGQEELFWCLKNSTSERPTRRTRTCGRGELGHDAKEEVPGAIYTEQSLGEVRPLLRYRYPPPSSNLQTRSASTYSFLPMRALPSETSTGE